MMRECERHNHMRGRQRLLHIQHCLHCICRSLALHCGGPPRRRLEARQDERAPIEAARLRTSVVRQAAKPLLARLRKMCVCV